MPPATTPTRIWAQTKIKGSGIFFVKLNCTKTMFYSCVLYTRDGSINTKISNHTHTSPILVSITLLKHWLLIKKWGNKSVCVIFLYFWSLDELLLCFLSKHPPAQNLLNCSTSHVTRGAESFACYPQQQLSTAWAGDFRKYSFVF